MMSVFMPSFSRDGEKSLPRAAGCAYFVLQSMTKSQSPSSIARRVSSPLCRRGARGLFCCALLLLSALPLRAHAGDGFLGIDHELDLNQRGIWARKYQVGLEFGVIATEIGGSLWLGNDDELGHTLWQTIDATAISSVVVETSWLPPRA